MFLLAPIFQAFPGTDFIEGNTYAALKELDFLMSTASRTGPSDSVRYLDDFSVDWSRHAPYDQIYLIDNSNERGTRFNRLEQILRFIGRALYVNTTVVAEQGDDVIDNITGRGKLRDARFKKKAHYAGMGAFFNIKR